MNLKNLFIVLVTSGSALAFNAGAKADTTETPPKETNGPKGTPLISKPDDPILKKAGCFEIGAGPDKQIICPFVAPKKTNG